MEPRQYDRDPIWDREYWDGDGLCSILNFISLDNKHLSCSIACARVSVERSGNASQIQTDNLSRSGSCSFINLRSGLLPTISCLSLDPLPLHFLLPQV